MPRSAANRITTPEKFVNLNFFTKNPVICFNNMIPQ